MSSTVIRVENLSKQYRLGEIGTGSLAHDVNRWWHRIRGKEDPYSTVGQAKDRLVTGKNRAKSENLDPDYVWVLKDINFDVQQGEILGVIGRNGAGKSTLLKILSRVTAPTGGAVKVKGRIASLLEVGTGFHPDLTGRENVFLNGAILGMTKAEITRKFDEIVHFSGCDQFIDTPVKRYSSGMYVRLAFAVAAHLEPEILILDEVLAVGDAEFQRRCLGKMKDVASGGRTVIFVSHNMTAVSQLCDRAILLRQGQIAAAGDLDRVIREYSGASDSVSQAGWINDGVGYENEILKPLRVAIVSESGRLASLPLRNDEDYWVTIDLQLKVNHPALEIGYALFLEDQQLLFWSFHTDGPESEWPQLKLGFVTLRAPWPKHLLNEGSYRVEFGAALTKARWLFEPGVSSPGFNIEVSGGLSSSPHFNQKRAGILAPVYPWIGGSSR